MAGFLENMEGALSINIPQVLWMFESRNRTCGMVYRKGPGQYEYCPTEISRRFFGCSKVKTELAGRFRHSMRAPKIMCAPPGVGLQGYDTFNHIPMHTQSGRPPLASTFPLITTPAPLSKRPIRWSRLAAFIVFKHWQSDAYFRHAPVAQI